MKVEKFFNPICEENMYVIYLENKDCYIVDPGDIYMTKVINYIKENNLNLKAILLTHAHFDHIMGIEKVLDYKDVPVYVHKLEKSWLYTPKMSQSILIGKDFVLRDNVNIVEYEDNDKVFEFTVIHTPGHSFGSSCFYNKENNILISGDTILKNSYGRTDFPTGNYNDMIESLSKIVKLPEETTIYPGHGPNTILQQEKKYYKYY